MEGSGDRGPCRFFVETRWAGSEDEPSRERMREILAELDVDDEEHPDTWLGHENGWMLTAHQDGRLVLDCDGGYVSTRYMRDVPRGRVLELWLLLADDKLDEIERAPWQPGTGEVPPTEAQRAEKAANHAAAVLAYHRRFYDLLGPERDEPRCAEPGCTRGAVRVSVCCRLHHFEAVMHVPCPFSD